MASENETVEIKDPGIEDVLIELRGYDSKPPPKFAWLRIADMLEGAWKREIDVYKSRIRHLQRSHRKLADENKQLVEKFVRDESAWRREKTELERKVHENNLKFLAEKARHTDTYKDERIRAQDAEIKTLNGELTELRGALKRAYGTLYSISCSRYGKGLTCTDDIHDLVTMARECSDELYVNENLRKALEGGKSPCQ